MHRLIPSLAFLVLVQVALAADSRTFVGKAERISDGDTIKFTITEGTSIGTSFTVRLAGVDAPEISHRKGRAGQPFGPESTANLRRLIEGKAISVQQIDKDRYGRLVGVQRQLESVVALPHQESYFRPPLPHVKSYQFRDADRPPPAVSYSHVSSEAANRLCILLTKQSNHLGKI